MGASQSAARMRVSPAAEPAGVSGSLPQPIDGLLFDPSDVLYDVTVWRRWLLRVLSQLGVHTSYRSFFHLWDRDFLDDVHRGRREFCEAFQAFLLSVGLSPGQIDEVEAACQARRQQWEHSTRLLPGVQATLGRLREAGMVMGVLADSEYPAVVLAQRFERLGLAGVFKAVVSSIDLEQIKPDPVCYRAALQAMELEAERVAFVGHDPADLAGAARAGMATIAFNYGPDAKADVFIHRFEQLLSLVGLPLKAGRG